MSIPRVFAGWGAAPGAPFHGFEVFLDHERDPDNASCIGLGLELSRRFLVPEDTPLKSEPDSHAVSVTVGNRKGFKITKVGSVGGKPIENITIFLKLPREQFTNDCTITLVTPVSERRRTEPVFQKFVASLKFW